METTPKIGQKVGMENFDEFYMVKAISEDGVAVELLALTGKPCSLLDVPIADLIPAPAKKPSE